MANILKQFLIILGAFLAGFGIGLIASRNFLLIESYFWPITIGSLVLGGFLMGGGLMQNTKKERQIKQEPESEIKQKSESEEEVI